MKNIEKKEENINHDHLFSSITEEEREQAVEQIIASSSPRKSFFVLMVAASLICTLGILRNNAAVIIGAMLVAPMLSSILAVSLGIVMADYKLIYRSIRVILLATLFCIGISFMMAMLLEKPSELNHEMILRTSVSLEAVLVGLIAGVAASLAIIKKELKQYLVGTAIAVALIPPISMSAISLRMLNVEFFYQSFMLYIFNLVAIILSSLLVFSLSRFYVSRYKAQEELKLEDELLGRNTKT